MTKNPFNLLMVSVSNIPVDGRVVRSAIALASRFNSVRVIGFTRGERNPPKIDNLDFDLFFLKETSQHGNMSSFSRNFVRLWILIRMAWEVINSRADVYYSHEVHLLPIVWLAGKIRGAKIVYDIHEIYGEMGTGLISYILKVFEMPLIRTCDVLITTNTDRASLISQKYDISSSKVNAIRNLPIINSCTYSIMNIFENTKSIKCVYHGRISLSDRALDVLVKVIGSMGGFELVILGIDSLGQRAKLEKIAQQSPLRNIFFLDPIPPDHLVSFSVGADIGILPYRNIGLNTSLASPNKIWEYIASGLFVLTTPFPEAMRLFEACPCGIAADISNEKNLKRQLDRIRSLPDLELRKKAGEQYFNKHLAWEKEAKKLQNIVSRPLYS